MLVHTKKYNSKYLKDDGVFPAMIAAFSRSDLSSSLESIVSDERYFIVSSLDCNLSKCSLRKIVII